jgi:hypothetical protein
MRFYNQKIDSVIWINSKNIESMEYKIEQEEIHVRMMNNASHIIKYSEVGQKTFDELLDYNFDLKK